MSEGRLDPRGIKPSDTNDDVMQTIDGVTAWGPLALPTVNLPLVSVVNGIPGLVFDNTGHIVYTEGTT